MPPHLQFNRFVHGGYRPIHTLYDVPRYLFTLHNESWNIATHLGAALLFLYWLATTDYAPGTAAGALRLVNDIAALVCMAGSSVYHVFMSTATTQASYQRLLGLDVAGIWVTQLGGAVALYFLLLPCAPWEVVYAIALGPSLASLLILARGGGIKSRAAGFLVAQATRILVPLVAVCGGHSHWGAAFLATHISVEMAAVVGGAINAARVPERWWPGAFDSGLNSHTIMHALVVVNLVGQHVFVAQRAASIEAGGAGGELAVCLSGHVPGWVRGVADGLVGGWSVGVWGR